MSWFLRGPSEVLLPAPHFGLEGRRAYRLNIVSPSDASRQRRGRGPVFEQGQIDHGSNQMLSKIIENNGQHDLRVIRQRHRGQNEPGAIVVHA